ncbi:TPA: hypothetical protein HLY57_19850 [Escherichia coli]|uniref:Lysis protein n=1 Tax=Escherichia coli TaxID=562 RepID=A0AAN3IQ44_ECOLX|nr:lysis protein [Escherichia coli]EFA8257901.1 lysis protein [Escherichia coli O157]HBP1558551.1 lysis protein [Escherichia coli str. K-12 substr. MG1655star]EES1964647.1 lysis protein [Escherichia coli]EEW4742150.1 lysis protein [Escherichia coli]
MNHSLVTAKVKREIKRWPKSENEALRDDVAAGRRRLHIRSICPSPREATTASGVDNAAPPDWQTSLNRIISSLRERLITMQKQL